DSAWCQVPGPLHGRSVVTRSGATAEAEPEPVPVNKPGLDGLTPARRSAAPGLGPRPLTLGFADQVPQQAGELFDTPSCCHLGKYPYTVTHGAKPGGRWRTGCRCGPDDVLCAGTRRHPCHLRRTRHHRRSVGPDIAPLDIAPL